MGFERKVGVFRHVVGQPLLCERYYEVDERQVAEDYCKNFDMVCLLEFDLWSPNTQDRQESKDNTFYKPDAIDMGTINLGDKQPEAERQIAQARKQAETYAIEKVALDQSQEQGQRTAVQESDNKQAPKVVTSTTTPVSPKNAAASKGTEKRAEVETKKSA